MERGETRGGRKHGGGGGREQEICLFSLHIIHTQAQHTTDCTSKMCLRARDSYSPSPPAQFTNRCMARRKYLSICWPAREGEE